ncbi:lysophospholipase L1-like esterase [Paenibacillus cellulosilyticus]|uniref:Lysophospholipase L1-like esterase n=1 Tax=Paenibacillus cellulosilyticus TaxID=375489 RepID=A0A2V2YZA9_9BACL|nr:GDSL-type esterase/lipase family protein [Paenibacillus cellulosilyticus]PWV98664.1 lysophospholipase L1-like esterase [Paenibacillus cellulosilyticus]QKS43827.1 lipolytic protein G-D-S-L family [Paenibacillus cellulosilyticus]
MFSKVLSIMMVSILAMSIFAASAFAKSDNARKSLAALGDSITYGYNLGSDNSAPSQYAFPYLMAQVAKLKVTNLAVPKLTSSQLLELVKNDKSYRQELKHADYVTLSIGNNDLLAAVSSASTSGTLDVAQLQASLVSSVLPGILGNVKSTIEEIRSLTDAPIVVYNIYNPYQVNNQPMHTLTNQLLTQLVNNNLAALVQSLATADTCNTLVLADAYTAFGENQLLYVRQNDIHPTIEGQQLLAEIGEAALGLKK